MRSKLTVLEHKPVQRLQLSEQERQLIEVVRENAVYDGFRLLLERQSGSWEVILEAPEKGRKKHGTARGVGASFAAAWDNMNPRWS